MWQKGVCLRLGGFVEEWAGDVTGTVAKKQNGVGDDFLGVAFFLWKNIPAQYMLRLINE